MLKRKIVIFAPEFWPVYGGIAEYTLQLAKTFEKSNILNYLITTQYQNKKYPFKINFLNNNWDPANNPNLFFIFRKIKSFLLIQERKRFLNTELVNLKNSGSSLLVNSLFVDLSWFAIKFAQENNISYGIIIHGLDLIEISDKRKTELGEIISKSSFLILNSNSTCDLLISMFPETNIEKIKVIYPPFDEEQFKVDVKEDNFLDKWINTNVISTVSRLVERKGVDLAIKSMCNLLKENDSWVYLIAGSGPEEEKLKKLVKDLNLKEHVFFLGRITEAQKFILLKKSEIFLLPNHSLDKNDIEGFGISFVEAQYFKNVVIGGKSGGVVESVKDGESGFLIESNENTIFEIEKKVAFLIDDETCRMKMQIKAHEFVCANFEIKAQVGMLENCSSFHESI